MSLNRIDEAIACYDEAIQLEASYLELRNDIQKGKFIC